MKNAIKPNLGWLAEKPFSVLTVLILFCLTGCSSTKLVDVWQDRSFAERPLKKILVLGIFNPDTNRRIYEDGLVANLKKQGHSAVAGYTLMPDTEDYDEKEEIQAAVKKTGADGVMVATLKAVDRKDRYVPPRVDYYPSRVGYRHGFYGYYGTSFHSVYQPGYTVTDTVVRLELALFSVKTEKIIWGATSRSVNPSSGEKVTQETSRAIIEELKKTGLL